MFFGGYISVVSVDVNNKDAVSEALPLYDCKVSLM
jgi:hypothetical protein